MIITQLLCLSTYEKQYISLRNFFDIFFASICIYKAISRFTPLRCYVIDGDKKFFEQTVRIIVDSKHFSNDESIIIIRASREN